MTAPALRDYQERAIGALRRSYATGHHAPLLVMPTAAGKTVLFAEASRLALLKGTPTQIAVHRRELVKQAVNKLADVGVQAGIIAAGFKPTDASVQVASIASAIRRPPFNAGLLIIDEAHHASAESYHRLAEALPRARRLGVTATAARRDGKGLGVDHNGLFDDLVIGASVKELIDGGWLSPFKVYVVRTRLDLRGIRAVAGDYDQGQLAQAVIAADLAGNAVAEYARRADHQPCVVFCVTVAHAEASAAAFRGAGYRAASVHGELPAAERDELIAALGTGAIEVLTSCEILGEGVDVPTIGCAVLLRPTKSLTVYLQQVGRGLRPAPGKAHLTIIDGAGNALTHGLPDEERAWSLAAAPKRASIALEVTTDGEVSETQRDLVVDENAEMVEFGEHFVAVCALPYRAFVARPRSDPEIEAYRRSHGYKRGWSFYVRRQQAEMFGAAP